MGKLPVLSGKDVCGILARHGFVEVRQRGSHIVMQKRLSDTTVTVAKHNKLRMGMLQCVMCPSASSAAMGPAKVPQNLQVRKTPQAAPTT